MDSHNKEPIMPNPAALEQQMAEVREDVREIRASMSKIADAITRLAVLEEKHQSINSACERMATKIEKIEERQRDAEHHNEAIVLLLKHKDEVEKKIADLEIEQVRIVSTAEGVSKTVKTVWALIGAGVVYGLAKMFGMPLLGTPANG